eukprot:SAG11_NODE_3380_length_2488_cov_3.306823_2_plen_175_part_00
MIFSICSQHMPHSASAIGSGLPCSFTSSSASSPSCALRMSSASVTCRRAKRTRSALAPATPPPSPPPPPPPPSSLTHSLPHYMTTDPAGKPRATPPPPPLPPSLPPSLPPFSPPPRGGARRRGGTLARRSSIGVADQPTKAASAAAIAAATCASLACAAWAKTSPVEGFFTSKV